MLVCAVAELVCEASGTHDCLAPVYDMAIPDIAPQPVDAVILTLFAPVAGARRQYKYVNLSDGHCTAHIRVIATQLYVTAVTSSVAFVKNPTKSILSLPEQV